VHVAWRTPDGDDLLVLGADAHHLVQLGHRMGRRLPRDRTLPVRTRPLRDRRHRRPRRQRSYHRAHGMRGDPIRGWLLGRSHRLRPRRRGVGDGARTLGTHGRPRTSTQPPTTRHHATRRRTTPPRQLDGMGRVRADTRRTTCLRSSLVAATRAR
jgi:hypothetical protein